MLSTLPRPIKLRFMLLVSTVGGPPAPQMICRNALLKVLDVGRRREENASLNSTNAHAGKKSLELKKGKHCAKIYDSLHFFLGQLIILTQKKELMT